MNSVLITGGAGFIGSHLAALFLSEGYRVVAVDNFSTGRTENLAGLAGRKEFTFLEADIRDRAALETLAPGLDLIVHLAASVGVGLILSNPVESMQNNLAGTDAILQWAHRHGSRLLLASSSEVYGQGIKVPFSETDPLVVGDLTLTRWSYAVAKIADESLALAYHRQFGLPVTIARLFNTVGPRQSALYGMVLPTFVAQARQGGPLTVFGDGDQRRCFCDVADVARALLGLARHPDAVGEIFNVGSMDEVSILALAERVRDLVQPDAGIQVLPYRQAYQPGFEDVRRRVPDTAKIKRVLGWEPSLRLDDIIRRVGAPPSVGNAQGPW